MSARARPTCLDSSVGLRPTSLESSVGLRPTRRTLVAGLGAVALLPGAARARQDEAGPRYAALGLQTACDAVNPDPDRAAARARMAASIDRIAAQIAAAKGFIATYEGAPLRLVVLPEYVLTGFPLQESREEWRDKAALDPDGEEYAALGAIARRFGLHLCVNAYETDPAFPGLYFQANVVFDPDGAAVLRYRRMISLFTPTPFDVWTAYLETYGEAAVFPVVETEIGVLGTIASEEILYPEIARILSLKGAELLLHPTSEAGGPDLSPKAVARRARAFEAMAYLVSANTAEIRGTAVPAASTDAMSQVLDPRGRVLAEAESGESLVAHAVLDLPGLRALRARAGMLNVRARTPSAAFAPFYAAAPGPSPDAMADGAMRGQAAALDAQRAVIDRLRAGRASP